MKKVICALMFAGLIAVPFGARAQTVIDPVEITDRAVLEQLLSLYTQLLAILQAQLADQIATESKIDALEERSRSQSDSLGRIEENTKPKPVETPPTPTPMSTPGSITVTITPGTTIASLARNGNYEYVNENINDSRFGTDHRELLEGFLADYGQNGPAGFVPATPRELLALANQHNLSNVISETNAWLQSGHRYAVGIAPKNGGRHLTLMDLSFPWEDVKVAFVRLAE